MCLIAHFPKLTGKVETFKDRYFEDSWKRNSDGWGCMFPENGKVEVYRATEFDEALELYEKYKNKPNFAMHFRLGTSGTKDIHNVHPFQVLDKEENGIDLYMMHNGIISTIERKKSMCDTWHFVEHYLKPILKHDYTLLMKGEIEDLIESKIGRGSKLLFTYANDKYAGVHIIHEKQGDWLNKDEVWVSNKYSINEYTNTWNYKDYKSNYQGYCWSNQDADPGEPDTVAEHLKYNALPSGERSFNHKSGFNIYDDGRAFKWSFKHNCFVLQEEKYNMDGTIKEEPKEAEVETPALFKQPTLELPPPAEKQEEESTTKRAFASYESMYELMEDLGYCDKEELIDKILDDPAKRQVMSDLLVEFMTFDNGDSFLKLSEFIRDYANKEGEDYAAIFGN